MNLIDKWSNFLVKHFHQSHRQLGRVTIPEDHKWMRQQAYRGLLDCTLEIISFGRVVGKYRANWMKDN